MTAPSNRGGALEEQKFCVEKDASGGIPKSVLLRYFGKAVYPPAKNPFFTVDDGGTVSCFQIETLIC